MVLPLLPTTPFILLAAVFCPLIPAFSSLAAVSLVVWRLSAPLAETPGHAAGAKPRAIAVILITFAISLWLVKMMWVRILLLVILTCLLIFMWRIPWLMKSNKSTEAL